MSISRRTDRNSNKHNGLLSYYGYNKSSLEYSSKDTVFNVIIKPRLGQYGFFTASRNTFLTFARLVSDLIRDKGSSHACLIYQYYFSGSRRAGTQAFSTSDYLNLARNEDSFYSKVLRFSATSQEYLPACRSPTSVPILHDFLYLGYTNFFQSSEYY